MQPDPVHRSISTAVCAIVPFVHLNAIDLRALAAAVSMLLWMWLSKPRELWERCTTGPYPLG